MCDDDGVVYIYLLMIMIDNKKETFPVFIYVVVESKQQVKEK